MKLNSRSSTTFAALAALSALALIPLANVSRAQAPTGPDTSSSTTEDSTGKVTSIQPGSSISVTSRRGPFTYRLGSDLHVVGPDGKPMKVTDVAVGEEVTVYYYIRSGNPTVARISVLKTAPREKRDK